MKFKLYLRDSRLRAVTYILTIEGRCRAIVVHIPSSWLVDKYKIKTELEDHIRDAEESQSYGYALVSRVEGRMDCVFEGDTVDELVSFILMDKLIGH